MRQRDARHAREQEEARLIQRALIPSAMPHLRGCDIAARWQPASGIGGDCYDLLKFSGTRAGIAIADVVGKGLPAALLMSNLQAAVRAFAIDGTAPHTVTSSVNRLLARNIAVGKFVTFCYLVVDAAAGTIEFANAGHNPPLLIHPDGRIDYLAATGVVLGVFPDGIYESRTVTMGPGDRLICYTDGITEAVNSLNEEFGDDRLIAAVRSCGPDATAATIVDTVTAEVALWTGGTVQDDATLIAVTRDNKLTN